ncbi:hypothetical protein QFZ23_000257 [Arthrobacter globiformis]|nr:hypothetical protein [Arthrobacter globiformis]
MSTLMAPTLTEATPRQRRPRRQPLAAGEPAVTSDSLLLSTE